jgi:hypothetical protein
MRARAAVGLLLTVVIIGGCVPGLTGSGVDHVRVMYSGCWTGAIAGFSSDASEKSVDGCGSETFAVSGSIVSVLFQKKDDAPIPLTVQLLSGSDVVKEDSTTAAYGVVTLAK